MYSGSGEDDEVSSHESITAETYAEINLLIEKNDPELVNVTIDEDREFWPSSASEWQKIGESIAHNTHLKILTLIDHRQQIHDTTIIVPGYTGVTDADLECFLCSVAKNPSIQTLQLDCP